MTSDVVEMAFRILVSSAKWLIMDELIHWLRSLIYIRKRMGPRTVPWGTPLRTLAGYEWVPFIETVCIRLDRYDLIQSRSLPWIP